jgi:hypothetical protein
MSETTIGNVSDVWVTPFLSPNGNVSNVLVTPFQPQIATFSVKNVIFQEILRLNNIESNSLNQSKWLRWHAHVPNMLVKI